MAEQQLPERPTRLNVRVDYRYRNYNDTFSVSWDTFVEFYEAWCDTIRGNGTKNPYRLQHGNPTGGYTSRSIDLRDIQSIEPSPEDFAP